MMFQSRALNPHLTVRQNIGFGFRLANIPKDQIARIFDAIAAALQLDKLSDVWLKELSGGQRQRVAIGRAIVRNPKTFLFDEPLSKLDASLRGQMRIEIAELHAKLATTMNHVAHDQVEVMTMVAGSSC